MQQRGASWVLSVLWDWEADHGAWSSCGHVRERKVLAGGPNILCRLFCWADVMVAVCHFLPSAHSRALSYMSWSLSGPPEPRQGVYPTKSSLFWKDEFSANLSYFKSSLIISTKTNYLQQTKSDWNISAYFQQSLPASWKVFFIHKLAKCDIIKCWVDT